jgi:hypothetical protein
MAKSFSKQPRTEVRDVHNPLDVYLFLQSEVMAAHAFSQGKIVPDDVVKTIEYARGLFNTQSSAVDEMDTAALTRTHAALSALIAPARPGTLLLIEHYRTQKTFGAWLGTVPLLRRLIVLSVIMLVGLITVSLSPNINYEELQLGMFGHSGFELLLNLLLLLFASGLGATFSGLYTTINAVNSSQYDEIEAVSFFVRFTMGLITGLFIAELIPMDLSAGAGGGATGAGAVGKVSLAVLGGFSAHILYGILSKMVNSFQSMVGEGDDMLKEIGRLDSQIQKQVAAQAAERERQRLAEKKQKAAAKAQVLPANSSVSANPSVSVSVNPSVSASPSLSANPSASESVSVGASVSAGASPRANALPPITGWEVPDLLQPKDYFSQGHPSVTKGVNSVPRAIAFSGVLVKYDRGGAENIYDDEKVKADWKKLDQTAREVKVHWLACKNTVSYMAKNAGYRDTGLAMAHGLLESATEGGKFVLRKAATYDQALADLDKNLQARIPVIVGVSYGVQAGYSKWGQNHFILIVGRGEDAKGRYYTYFDPGRGTTDGHNTQRNRLYIHKDPDGQPHPYHVSGNLGGKGKKYFLCEIRRMEPC